MKKFHYFFAGRPIIISGGIKDNDEVRNLTHEGFNIAGCSTFTHAKFGNGILLSYPEL